MPESSDSFKKFNYAVRPSKQVERKILMELLLRLGSSGFDIPSYTYIGFGSVYYVDFVLFHKYLFIRDMICVEWGEIPKRMEFNKPYHFIQLQMQPLASVIKTVFKPRKKYVVWLDYDRQLDTDMLADIDNCVVSMPKGSIFLVTIEARARVPMHVVETEELTSKGEQQWLVRHFKESFGRLLGRKRRITVDDLDPVAVPQLYWEAVSAQIRESIAAKGDGDYMQLFHFLYADGAEMLTIGGVVGDDAELNRLRASEFMNHKFVKQGGAPVTIKVPPLTVREKQWLDSNLTASLKARSLLFELDDDVFAQYKEYYKEYPTYVEAIS